MLLLLACLVIAAVLAFAYVHLISSVPLFRCETISLPREWLQEKLSSAPQSLPPKPRPDDSLAHILPPSRRSFLPSHIDPHSPHISESTVLQSQIRMDADFKSCETTRYTPTSFSKQEIQQLGNFPNYATLSGIPLPSPFPDFDIDKALPRPYRPFRWNYHQTMSLSKMDTDWWIELENTYRQRIEARKELHWKHGKAVLDYLPGSELACKELLEMAIQFLCARYPQYFACDSMIFSNGILGIQTDIESKHPLEILLDHVPEDFTIMIRDSQTGRYSLRAGVICYSIGWTLGDKLGLGLDEIHQPVPDYKEKMAFSMHRYFSKMPTDKPIQRGAWSLEVGQVLHITKDDPEITKEHGQDPNLSIEDCFLRVDWQTLRRLPLSGSVVFNFKAFFTPVSELRDEPRVPSILSEILKHGKKDLMEYKKSPLVEHVLIPAFEAWKREQEEAGLVDRDWNVATLEDSPFFAGWEAKWRSQQGF